MLQLFCLACCSFAGEIPAGDPLTIPPFDAPFGQQRVAACVDASTSHAIGTANNTRWTFVGVPQGTPPPGGFPIFLSLLPWPDTPENTNVTAFGDGTCGNGWTPNGFFGQSCMRLMKDHHGSGASWAPKSTNPVGIWASGAPCCHFQLKKALFK